MTKSAFYTTTWDYQPSGWTEKRLQSTSQSQTYTRKGHGHHLSICCWSDPLLLFKSPWDHSENAQQIDERGTEICKALSWHWSVQRAQFFSMTTSNHMSHNQHFRSWMNWATKFCLIRHIHLTSCQPTTTSSSISATFCRGNTSTTSRMQKMLARVCRMHSFFMLEQ